MEFTLALDGELLRSEFHGVLGPEDLERFGDEMVRFEAGLPRPPDRVIDLRGVTRVDIGFDAVNSIARLRHATLDRPIRSALVAASAIHVGYARMYQTLSEHPLITVRIFPTVEAALDWLSSPA
ncbi:MAG TPA: hypothetical protein VFH27_04815 [Longimicrobiaceae bacterium]|nr:hypothetical protein [Longimicrobiaceae bacterium]